MKPVSTFSRFTKLRSSRPVPDTSISAMRDFGDDQRRAQMPLRSIAGHGAMARRLQAEAGEPQRRHEAGREGDRAGEQHGEADAPSHRRAASRSTSLRAAPSWPGRAWPRGPGRGATTDAADASIKRFDEQLADQPRAIGAERGAHRQFLLAQRAAREQQVGDVHARDQQHGDHRGAEQRAPPAARRRPGDRAA